MTPGSTVNMAAENSDDPPGVLQGPAQPRHYIPAFEVEPVRPHRNLKWWMVRKNRDGFGGLAAHQINQMSDPVAAKVTLVAA